MSKAAPSIGSLKNRAALFESPKAETPSKPAPSRAIGSLKDKSPFHRTPEQGETPARPVPVKRAQTERKLSIANAQPSNTTPTKVDVSTPARPDLARRQTMFEQSPARLSVAKPVIKESSQKRLSEAQIKLAKTNDPLADGLMLLAFTEVLNEAGDDLETNKNKRDAIGQVVKWGVTGRNKKFVTFSPSTNFPEKAKNPPYRITVEFEYQDAIGGYVTTINGVGNCSQVLTEFEQGLKKLGNVDEADPKQKSQLVADAITKLFGEKGIFPTVSPTVKIEDLRTKLETIYQARKAEEEKALAEKKAREEEAARQEKIRREREEREVKERAAAVERSKQYTDTSRPLVRLNADGREVNNATGFLIWLLRYYNGKRNPATSYLMMDPADGNFSRGVSFKKREHNEKDQNDIFYLSVGDMAIDKQGQSNVIKAYLRFSENITTPILNQARLKYSQGDYDGAAIDLVKGCNDGLFAFGSEEDIGKMFQAYLEHRKANALTQQDCINLNAEREAERKAIREEAALKAAQAKEEEIKKLRGENQAVFDALKNRQKPKLRFGETVSDREGFLLWLSSLSNDVKYSDGFREVDFVIKKTDLRNPFNQGPLPIRRVTLGFKENAGGHAICDASNNLQAVDGRIDITSTVGINIQNNYGFIYRQDLAHIVLGAGVIVKDLPEFFRFAPGAMKYENLEQLISDLYNLYHEERKECVLTAEDRRIIEDRKNPKVEAKAAASVQALGGDIKDPSTNAALITGADERKVTSSPTASTAAVEETKAIASAIPSAAASIAAAEEEPTWGVGVAFHDAEEETPQADAVLNPSGQAVQGQDQTQKR